MAPLDLKSLAKNKVCGLGAGKKAWEFPSRNSGQMAPGLKWYLRSSRATSRGTGTAMYQVTSLTSHGTHNSSPRALSRWGAKPESVVPFCPDTTVDVGSYYFCRRASAVIIQHGRQRKGHKRKFIFSSLKLMASSLFILLSYLILCIASESGRENQALENESCPHGQ